MQHPVLAEREHTENQIEQTLEAIKDLDFQKVLIYPNVDSGNSKIIRTIDKYKKMEDFFVFENLERKLYLSLLKNSSILVGNSSSGILEASSFKIPVVNIGNRQRGRLQSENIINCDYSKKTIIKSIKKATSNKKFLLKIVKCKNPYGDGNSSRRILKILKNITINNKLLDKRITYWS